jgi:hypothetical protein
MKSLIEAARIPVASAKSPVVYDSINDLPIALRRSLVRMYREGMSPLQIAAHHALPEQWVQLFVETPPGASHH